MRVNRSRLDLRSLTVNQVCTITTGVSDIKLVHLGRSIQMGLYLKGVAPMRISDRVSSIEDEPGRRGPTEWLHLEALAPKRLYLLTVTGVSDAGHPTSWQVEDATPGASKKAKVTSPRGFLGKFFGRG